MGTGPRSTRFEKFLRVFLRVMLALCVVLVMWAVVMLVTGAEVSPFMYFGIGLVVFLTVFNLILVRMRAKDPHYDNPEDHGR